MALRPMGTLVHQFDITEIELDNRQPLLSQVPSKVRRLVSREYGLAKPTVAAEEDRWEPSHFVSSAASRRIGGVATGIGGIASEDETASWKLHSGNKFLPRFGRHLVQGCELYRPRDRRLQSLLLRMRIGGPPKAPTREGLTDTQQGVEVKGAKRKTALGPYLPPDFEPKLRRPNAETQEGPAKEPRAQEPPPAKTEGRNVTAKAMTRGETLWLAWQVSQVNSFIGLYERAYFDPAISLVEDRLCSHTIHDLSEASSIVPVSTELVFGGDSLDTNEVSLLTSVKTDVTGGRITTGGRRTNDRMLLSRQLLESNTGLNRFLHRGGRPTAVHPTERSAEPDGDADDGDNYLGRRAKGYRREIATDSSDEEDGSSTHGRTHGRHHAGSHSGHSSGRQSRSDGHYRERIAFQRAATAAKFVRARNQLKLELSQIEQFALPARYVLPSTPAMDAGTSPDTTLVSRDSAVMTPQKRKEPSESRPLWKRATTLSGIAYGNSNQLSDRFEAAVPRIDVAPEAVGLIPRKQQPPRTLRTSGQETGGEETRGQELKGPAAGVGSMPSPATSAAETGVAETSVDHAPVSVCSYFTPAAAWKDVLGVEVFVPTSADKAALWPTYFHDLLQRCPNHPLKATVTKLSRSHLPPSTRENTTSTLLTSSGDMTPSVMGQGVMRREELLHALFG